MGHGDGDQATGGLASGLARCWRLDAVGHAVANQVLERTRHALQHTTVDFDAAAHDVQPNLLGRVPRRLSDGAVEAIGHAFKLDHAGSQQVILQLTGQTRLGRQLVFSRLQRTLQTALQRGHVVDRLGHEPRQFLEACEAVHFQWIEGLQGSLGRLHA